MLVYIRHGATSLNKGGDQERLRGWLPVPLAPKGEQQADAAGKRLRDVLPGPPDSFSASDLHRTQQTAAIVGQHLGIAATPDPRIRDWNTGKMAGTLVKDSLPQMKELIKNPDDPAPGGESINQYLDRFVPAMREKVMSPGVHVVVGHARGAMVLQGIADPVGGVGGDVNRKFLLERPDVPPGGILIINNKWHTKIDDPSGVDTEKQDG